MKHQVSLIVKTLGLICLIFFFIQLLSVISLTVYEMKSGVSFSFDYSYKSVFFISILPLTALYICFHFAVYKTNAVIKYFKLHEIEDIDEPEDKPFSMSRRTAFKSGIFIIGMYLLATNVPNIILQIVSWFTTELGSTNRNSLLDLTELFSPTYPNSIFYSIIYSIAGFFMAYQNSKIATYFLNRSDD